MDACNVIIPARYHSSRFPGKPLIDLAGKTMIRRVWERATLSGADGVYVATDDERIAEEVKNFGGEVVMTAADHPSGSDRICEAAQKIGLGPDDVVVNVQGDEPLISPAAIDQAAAAVTGDVRMATLCERITAPAQIFDPNVVKVVVDNNNMALYFSRAPVPWSRGGFGAAGEGIPAAGDWRRHLGIYAYSVSMLRQFVSWRPTALEKLESLEQLRVLSNGGKISVQPCGHSMPPGVDVPADVARVLEAIRGEPV